MSDPGLPAFDVSSSTAEGTTVVAVKGDVDTATAGELEAALTSAVRGSDAVHVDLGGVSFIDSSGLRALIISRQAAQDRDVPFGIVATTAAVDRLLRLTGLEDLLL